MFIPLKPSVFSVLSFQGFTTIAVFVDMEGSHSMTAGNLGVFVSDNASVCSKTAW